VQKILKNTHSETSAPVKWKYGFKDMHDDNFDDELTLI